MSDEIRSDRKTDPDYEAVRSRALGYLVQRGKLTNADLDEALEAGKAELRNDRRREASS